MSVNVFGVRIGEVMTLLEALHQASGSHNSW